MENVRAGSITMGLEGLAKFGSEEARVGEIGGVTWFVFGIPGELCAKLAGYPYISGEKLGDPKWFVAELADEAGDT